MRIDEDKGRIYGLPSLRGKPLKRSKIAMAPAMASNKNRGRTQIRLEREEAEKKKSQRGQAMLGNEHVTAKLGGHVFQFQDDMTGRKRIHSHAMRFALGVMDEEAKISTRSVARSLKENGRTDESNRVQVRSSRHTKAIVANLRKRLRDTQIPVRYVRIDDNNLNDLAVINMQRKEKIEENRQLIKKLEKQRETIQKAHDESKSRRDQVQRRLEESRATAERSIVHRLLIGHAKRMREIRTEMDGDEGNEIIGIKRPSNPSLTMCKMLGNVRSPYDGIL